MKDYSRTHNEGVERYESKYKVGSRKLTWYNARRAEAQSAKNRAWRKLKKQRNENKMEKYKEVSNEYIRIGKEEVIAGARKVKED